MWKYSTTWEKKSLKIGLSTSNPYPNFFVYPRFSISVTDQSPFSSCLLHFTSFISRLSVLTLPRCLLLYIFSLYGAHGVLFLSSPFSSASHSPCFVSPSKLPSYSSSQRKHLLLLLSAFELHFHLTPLLPVWLLLSNQASSFSCLVLAKGRGWSLDTEVPFSVQTTYMPGPAGTTKNLPMATHVVLTDYILTVIAFSRLRLVQFLADSQEQSNWHVTDVKKPLMSNPCPNPHVHVPNMDRSLQILKDKVTCIINSSNVWYFYNMYIRFISKVIQPPITKTLYEEEIISAWTVYYYPCHYKQHTLRYCLKIIKKYSQYHYINLASIQFVAFTQKEKASCSVQKEIKLSCIDPRNNPGSKLYYKCLCI